MFARRGDEYGYNGLSCVFRYVGPKRCPQCQCRTLRTPKSRTPQDDVILRPSNRVVRLIIYIPRLSHHMHNLIDHLESPSIIISAKSFASISPSPWPKRGLKPFSSTFRRLVILQRSLRDGLTKPAAGASSISVAELPICGQWFTATDQKQAAEIAVQFTRQGRPMSLTPPFAGHFAPTHSEGILYFPGVGVYLPPLRLGLRRKGRKRWITVCVPEATTPAGSVCTRRVSLFIQSHEFGLEQTISLASNKPMSRHGLIPTRGLNACPVDRMYSNTTGLLEISEPRYLRHVRRVSNLS